MFEFARPATSSPIHIYNMCLLGLKGEGMRVFIDYKKVFNGV